MNKQFEIVNGVKRRKIEWTSVVLGDVEYEGWTANIIKGCQHACQWQMPNGNRAQCYAKSLSDKFGMSKLGFAHLRFDDKEFETVLRHQPLSAIFMDSMSDLLGIGVPDDWIERVVELIRAKPEMIFQVLTKNPRRLRDFDWSRNVWLGVSTPAWYMHRDARMGFDTTTHTGRLLWYAEALTELSQVVGPAVRWSSLEPLSDNFVPVLREGGRLLDWAVVGAASDGARTMQPEAQNFVSSLYWLDRAQVPVFFKGNIDKTLAEKYGGWREAFPAYEPYPVLEQVV